jgi:hypothetical protein
MLNIIIVNYMKNRFEELKAGAREIIQEVVAEIQVSPLTTGVGENAEKKEPSYTAGGNAN